MSEVKPFEISKYAVLEAYKRVKANKGAEGIDKKTITDFEGISKIIFTKSGIECRPKHIFHQL